MRKLTLLALAAGALLAAGCNTVSGVGRGFVRINPQPAQRTTGYRPGMWWSLSVATSTNRSSRGQPRGHGASSISMLGGVLTTPSAPADCDGGGVISRRPPTPG